MTAEPLRLGTRRSTLAWAQAGWVAAALGRLLGREVTLVGITTAGDAHSGPLAAAGSTGLFTAAVRDAVLRGEVDLAVHSLKDLPTETTPGVELAAVPAREDPRDALCSPAGLGVAELAPGSRIGTGSPRRTALLRALGYGLDVVPLRGNVDTRLAAARRGELDAVVLARAGLARLGRLAEISEVLDPSLVLPAPGQGALAVEARAGEGWTGRLTGLEDTPSRQATTAERAVMAGLHAGCTAPVGALADIDDGELYLRAVVASLDGATVLRRSVTGPAIRAAALGHELAAALTEDGAAELVAVRSVPAAAVRPQTAGTSSVPGSAPVPESRNA